MKAHLIKWGPPIDEVPLVGSTIFGKVQQFVFINNQKYFIAYALAH